MVDVMWFQSTLPLRGVTYPIFDENYRAKLFQSTLPLRGVTSNIARMVSAYVVSIHTPLAGSDLALGGGDAVVDVSIHTPLAGSDDARHDLAFSLSSFNPHSPCGE